MVRMVLLRLSLCLLILLPMPAWGAITFDHITNFTPTQQVTSLTQSFTVASCTNCIMLVCYQQSHSGAVGTIANISSIKFGTTSLAFGNATAAGTGPSWGTAIFYLVNPSVTTANVVITLDANHNDRAAGGSIVLFQGVDQVTEPDATSVNNGTGTTLSTVITTIAANAWIMDCAIGQDDAGLTVGAGQTQRAKYTGGVNVEGFGVSTVDGKASPGNETMDWTQVSAGWSITALSLTPFLGSTPLQQGGLRRRF